MGLIRKCDGRNFLTQKRPPYLVNTTLYQINKTIIEYSSTTDTVVIRSVIVPCWQIKAASINQLRKSSLPFLNPLRKLCYIFRQISLRDESTPEPIISLLRWWDLSMRLQHLRRGLHQNSCVKPFREFVIPFSRTSRSQAAFASSLFSSQKKQQRQFLHTFIANCKKFFVAWSFFLPLASELPATSLPLLDLLTVLSLMPSPSGTPIRGILSWSMHQLSSQWKMSSPLSSRLHSYKDSYGLLLTKLGAFLPAYGCSGERGGDDVVLRSWGIGTSWMKRSIESGGLRQKGSQQSQQGEATGSDSQKMS